MSYRYSRLRGNKHECISAKASRDICKFKIWYDVYYFNISSESSAAPQLRSYGWPV